LLGVTQQPRRVCGQNCDEEKESRLAGKHA
jgi:hypothetical protein